MKIFSLLFFLYIFSISLFAQPKVEKYHRAKIIYNTVENFKKLEQLGVPMDHGIHKMGYYLTSDFSDSEIQKAKNLGLQVDVEIEDIQKFYIEQNKGKSKRIAAPQNVSCGEIEEDYVVPFNFALGSMGGYLTYEEMLFQLDAMHAAFPNLITQRENIGTFATQEGRFLQSVKITSNPNVPSSKPQVLYTAVHHAREPISLSQTIFYMWYLLENYESNEEIQRIVDNTELYFIPVINPDGYVFNNVSFPDGGGMWRKNRKPFDDGEFGVDNNRNYDYWKENDPFQSVWNTNGVSLETNGETYPGTSAMSEPENLAIQYFVDTHNFKVALNAHTFSNLLLHPFGYDLSTPSADETLFSELGELMVSKNDYSNIISSLLYAASGNSDDFMYGQTMNHGKIYAFTPEIGDSFWPPETDIIPLCKEMMYTNLTAAKVVNNYAYFKDTSGTFLGSSAIVNANFELTRLGLNGNGVFTVAINPISSNILSVGVPFNCGPLSLMETVNSSIELVIAPGTASNDLVVFEYVIDNGLFEEKKLVTKRFGEFQTVLEDNGSALLPTWTTTSWGTTAEDFVSPNTSITDSPFNNYSNNLNRRITLSNPINLTGVANASISFSAKWNLERIFDYVSFDVSTNNGLTWVQQCGKFTKTFTQNTVMPSVTGYTGNQESWVNEEISLSDYAGQIVNVRFRLVTDNGGNLDGFYFDDFKVNVLQNSVLSTSQVEIQKFKIYPNPTHSLLTVNTKQTEYAINIYNLLGQLVYFKESADGLQNIDVTDLKAGMYFIELSSSTFKETHKFYKN